MLRDPTNPVDECTDTPIDEPIYERKTVSPATARDRDELFREHELIRSEGTISKRVMALGFGLVFLWIGATLAFQMQEWYRGMFLLGIGTTSIAWAINRWFGHEPRPSH